MRSRNCTQIWSTLRSAISVAFEILVKKLQVKDTEAYQEMIRINYETFWGISTAILVILPFAISVWARFWQNCWPNHYHSLSSSRHLATMMKGNHSAQRFRINNVFLFRCRVWCRRRLKWYFIERYCELWFGKMSQSFKETTVSNFQLRDYRSINRWL